MRILGERRKEKGAAKGDEVSKSEDENGAKSKLTSGVTATLLDAFTSSSIASSSACSTFPPPALRRSLFSWWILYPRPDVQRVKSTERPSK